MRRCGYLSAMVHKKHFAGCVRELRDMDIFVDPESCTIEGVLYYKYVSRVFYILIIIEQGYYLEETVERSTSRFSM